MGLAPTTAASAALLVAVGLLLLRARRRRKSANPGDAAQTHLHDELAAAEAAVEALRARLAALGPHRPLGEVRIFMDGAFDMMHYGHCNAFRQARAVGTYLVVGVNDDASITRCKGAPPVMDDAERLAMVASCKWVDEVVPNVPYVMNDEYLAWVIQRYRIDFVVHGDDPCIVDGRDVYESAQRAGKYRTIPRTEGVSTTEIVGRMLLLNREHHAPPAPSDGRTTPTPTGTVSAARSRSASSEAVGGAGYVPRESKFMTTSQMLNLYSSGCAPPPPGARVVYVDGGWDMFHAGHVAFLADARARGDYLLVGVHNDAVVNRHRGRNFPLLNLNERVLSVLACKHVDDVLIDPPWHMTREMVAALRIAVVAHGTTHDANDDGGRDPYEVPKALGVYVELPSRFPLTVDTIVERINANHERLAAKVQKKMVAEGDYYANRYGFGAS
jgi:ethanolamine-phosphate cytidylyltransferase